MLSVQIVDLARSKSKVVEIDVAPLPDASQGKTAEQLSSFDGAGRIFLSVVASLM